MHMPENPDVMQRRTAHHEPGHVVIAADQGLRLSPEGIMVDQSGFGLGCYDRDPRGSDALRKSILLATFAGYYAEKRFCEEQSLGILDEDTWFLYNTDGHEAIKLLKAIAAEAWSNGSLEKTRLELKSQSKKLVDKRWSVIKAVASALLAKGWEPIRPLGSGDRWWNENQTMAKYLSGEEVIRILAQYGMTANE